MAEWKTTVALGDLHKKREDGDLTVQEVAQELARRLEQNVYASELDEEISELKDIAQLSADVDEEELLEQYNYVLEQLYDFGDGEHRIWFAPA